MTTKKVCDTILDAIGHTPLVRINQLTRGVTPATVLAKVETLSKQVGPMAQQVNDLQNGKMGFLIQEANKYAYRVCEIVGAHMWGGPAIGCLFGKR